MAEIQPLQRILYTDSGLLFYLTFGFNGFLSPPEDTYYKQNNSKRNPEKEWALQHNHQIGKLSFGLHKTFCDLYLVGITVFDRDNQQIGQFSGCWETNDKIDCKLGATESIVGAKVNISCESPVSIQFLIATNAK